MKKIIDYSTIYYATDKEFMKIKCTNINWDIQYGRAYAYQDVPKGMTKKQVKALIPKEIILEVPDKEYDDLDIADMLTDLTGFLIENYQYESISTNEPPTKFKPIGLWHQDGCPTLQFRDLNETPKYVCQ